MIIQCPQCSSAYDIPNAAAIVGRKVRCTSCAHVWRIEAPAAPAEPPPEEATADEPAPDESLTVAQPSAAQPQATASPPPPRSEPALERAAGLRAGASYGTVNGTGKHGASADPRDADMLGSESDEAEAAGSAADRSGEAAGSGLRRSRYGVPIGERPAEPDPDDFEPSPATGRRGLAAGRRLGAEMGGDSYAYNGFGSEPAGDARMDAGLPGGADPGQRWQDASVGQPVRPGDFDPSVDHVFGPDQPFDEEESRLGRGILILGWIGFVALLGALASYLYLGRSEVVRLLPGTAGLYAQAGLPVNVRGLELKDVAYRWQLDRKGRPALTVEGQVTNVSDRPRNIPSVVIVFRDENELELFDWATPVRFASLPPGQSTGFSATVPAPPEAVRSILVHFARQRR